MIRLSYRSLCTFEYSFSSLGLEGGNASIFNHLLLTSPGNDRRLGHLSRRGLYFSVLRQDDGRVILEGIGELGLVAVESTGHR